MEKRQGKENVQGNAFVPIIRSVGRNIYVVPNMLLLFVVVVKQIKSQEQKQKQQLWKFDSI